LKLSAGSEKNEKQDYEELIGKVIEKAKKSGKNEL